MAKVPFSKLKCKINDSTKEIVFNDITIEVKQYLSIQDKLALVGKVIELAHEQDKNFSNPIKARVYADIEILFYYTNLSFTDKQKEEIVKLYDACLSSGLLSAIMDNIPEQELLVIYNGVDMSIESIYKYQNSVLGILDTIKNDYGEMDLDIQKITAQFANPEQLNLIKDILTKLN